MPEALPSRVDASRLAMRGARLDNETPVASMDRLKAALTDPAGTVVSALAFARDASDRTTIAGHAQVEVSMTCQRCLRPMTVALDVDIAVVVTEDETADDDSEVVVAPGGTMSPLALVEDELILALPIVAMHEENEECEAPVDAAPVESKRPNPFAVLKSLKTE